MLVGDAIFRGDLTLGDLTRTGLTLGSRLTVGDLVSSLKPCGVNRMSSRLLGDKTMSLIF